MAMHHTHKKILKQFTTPFDVPNGMSRAQLLRKYRRIRTAMEAANETNCDWFTRLIAKQLLPAVEEAIATVENAPPF